MSRLEMIAQMIHHVTGADIRICERQALLYEDKPFVLKMGCD